MKQIVKRFKSRRGSEVVQVLMVSAVFLVLIATVFYKNIGNMLNGIFTDIDNWFDRNSSAIFADVATVD